MARRPPVDWRQSTGSVEDRIKTPSGALSDTDFAWQGVTYTLWGMCYSTGRLNVISMTRRRGRIGPRLRPGDEAVADVPTYTRLQLIRSTVRSLKKSLSLPNPA